MTRYLLAGGGTAGHVLPLLAVADALRKRDPDAVILILGTVEGLEQRLVPGRGYELLVVGKLPFPRRPNPAALRFPARFRQLVDRVASMIDDNEIDIVVGFGGYVSAPAYLAARRRRVPIVVHEANAKPGMANRLGSLLTRHVGVAFRGTRLRSARFVGMPLRSEIANLDRRAQRADSVEALGLDPRRPTLLVTGGSLGARRLNETIAASAALLLGAGWNILHITGAGSQVTYPRLAGYVVLAYLDRMQLAFAAADLVVARAGSSTVSELSALGLPAVYVPLAIGNGEQNLNTRDAVVARAALVVANADFTPEWIASSLLQLMRDRAELAAMSGRAAAIGVRDGADRMVALIDDALSGH